MMTPEEIREINARVLREWDGYSHGGIDLEEWEEVLARRPATPRAVPPRIPLKRPNPPPRILPPWMLYRE